MSLLLMTATQGGQATYSGEHPFLFFGSAILVAILVCYVCFTVFFKDTPSRAVPPVPEPAYPRMDIYRGFSVWYEDDIVSPNGPGWQVPNIGDLVIVKGSTVPTYVIAVDPITHFSTTSTELPK